MKQTLFDAVGGLPTLEKVHKIFYDKVYAHEWLGRFFAGHNQAVIEHRQTTFMAVKMGGDVAYKGREIRLAHRHMYITQELFEVRAGLLRASLEEAAVPDDLIEQWLRIDRVFNRHIVKSSIDAFNAGERNPLRRVVIPKN